MLIQPVSNTPKQHPNFGRMIFKPMNPDFIKAIESNPSFNKLSKELEVIGKDLIFDTGSCCGLAYIVSMKANNAPYKVANDVHLGVVAESLPSDCKKMVKQLEEYSCDTILSAIRLCKELFRR